MRWLYGITAVVCWLGMASVANAAPGDLDGAFGTGGLVTSAFPGADSGGANGMLIDPEGRIVVAGTAIFGTNFEFAIGRYLPNGTLDEQFGDGGLTVTDFTSSISELANAVVRQPDGKLVVAGEALEGPQNVLAVARYHANGVLDSSFDQDGKLVTDVETTTGEEARAVGLQSNGDVVVAGYGLTASGNEIVLARYLPDGTLDDTFGTAGNGKLVIPDTASQGEIATSLIVLPDDSLIVGGSVADSTGFNEHFLLRHLSRNGGVDGTFGDASGRLITTFPGGAANERITALAREPDGRIVAVGSSPTLLGSEQFETYVARYMPDGTLDSSFAGGAGREAFLLPGGVPASGNAVAIAPDGDIAIAGDAGDGSMMVARLRPDGTLDPTFGSGGARVIPFDENAFDGASADGVGVQSDGGIVAAGGVDAQNAPGGFALARVSGDSADLSVSASATPAIVRPGGHVTLSVTAHNAGPQAGQVVVLTITPPAGAGGVAISGSGTPAFTCTGTAPITCTIASLASGASSAVTVGYGAPPATSAHAAASISSVTADPSIANNSTGTDVTIDRTPPTMRLKLGSVTLGGLEKKGRLPVTVTISEAGKVQMTARSGKHRLASGSVSFTAAGTHRVTLHLSRKARRRLSGRSAVRLRIIAAGTDTAGNVGHAKLTRTIGRPKITAAERAASTP